MTATKPARALRPSPRRCSPRFPAWPPAASTARTPPASPAGRRRRFAAPPDPRLPAALDHVAAGGARGERARPAPARGGARVRGPLPRERLRKQPARHLRAERRRQRGRLDERRVRDPSSSPASRTLRSCRGLPRGPRPQPPDPDLLLALRGGGAALRQLAIQPRARARERGLPELGCATQRNFAAQLANPGDLVQPRSETARASERRDTVWTKYVKGDTTISKKAADEKISTKNQD